MSYIAKLVCSRCKKAYDPKDIPVLCDKGDLGRLDIVYDYEKIKDALDKEDVALRYRDIWKWKEFLPVDERFAIRLGEGATPLIRAERLGEKLGLRNLYLKDETRNPTGSFKDRAMAIGVAKGREKGVKVVTTASSGNAAAALAAYAAKAGLGTVAFVLESASKGKIAQLNLYGAKVVKVRRRREGEDPTVMMMLEATKRKGWYPCPSFGPFNPYQVEGPKTISYELAEEFRWNSYDWVFVPTGSGCLLTGLWKGMQDLVKVGFVEYVPKLVAVQPKGNSPLVRAIKEGRRFEEIEPEKNPSTIATGLSDPFPWDGDMALEGVKGSNGTGVAPSDEEIMEAVKDLAKYEGVFAEPSGAAGLAGLKKVVEEGVVDKDERVVVLVTGTGLKDVELIEGLVRETPIIDPDPRLIDAMV
jgi:threonine synthase